MLIAVYEWEMAGLRGVDIMGIWGDISELEAPKDKWNPDYRTLRYEANEQKELHPAEFARLILSGHMHRIGPMPQLKGYTGVPAGYEVTPSESDVAQPGAD